jgi:hypothetical protein
VIDYTKHDVRGGGERYDLVFVAVGHRVGPPSRRDCRGVLRADGAYLAVDRGRPRNSAADLMLLKQLAEAGELTPVIDRCYLLAQLAEAHRYVEEGAQEGERRRDRESDVTVNPALTISASPAPTSRRT